MAAVTPMISLFLYMLIYFKIEYKINGIHSQLIRYETNHLCYLIKIQPIII